jgi:hypothetical protein
LVARRREEIIRERLPKRDAAHEFEAEQALTLVAVFGVKDWKQERSGAISFGDFVLESVVITYQLASLFENCIGGVGRPCG